MSETTIKTQYYQEDLSAMLGLGEIITMYVCDDGRGNEVLRIMSKPQAPEEFKTVKASGKPAKKMPSRKPKRKVPSEPRKSPPNLDPGMKDPASRGAPSFASKAAGAVGGWLSKPMKRPDEW